MTDAELIASWAKIDSPPEMLATLLKHAEFFGDSYYSDLAAALTANAERVLAAAKPALWSEMVAEFHRATEQPVRTEPLLLVRSGDDPEHDAMRNLRWKLLEEEYEELQDAEAADDIVGIADGIADIIYVLIGTALVYGIPLERVFAEVHRSNMTKTVNGKAVRNAAGKIMKPDTYERPRIADSIWPGGEGRPTENLDGPAE